MPRCVWTDLSGTQIDNISLIAFSETTEVHLVLFNDLHVQQAFAIISQNLELMEVLRMPLQVTDDQEEHVGEPPEPDSIMKAAIKPVDRREGTIPAPIPSEREYSTHASLALGLANQKSYSRLSRYLQSVAKLDMIPVGANGNCLFSSIRRAMDCPLEYQTIHLKRQLVMMMANHHAFLFPLLKANLTTTYCFQDAPGRVPAKK